MIDYKVFFEQLLKGYSSSYDIERIGENSEGLVAKAHMHVEESQCMVFEELKMWTADADEYVYIYRIPNLTEDICKKLIDETYNVGVPNIKLEHVSLKKQHMRTNLVAVFICDKAEEGAIKLIKKCKIYKNFMFALKGWMEMHTALLLTEDGSVVSNRYGRGTGDYLRKHIDHYRLNVNKNIL